MKECILYEKPEEDKVKCLACKHYCVIQEGNTGICGVRQNKDGKLFLLVYGKASAANIDPIEKKPLYHFLSGTSIFSIGTVGCNFGCTFCQNWDISQVTRELRLKLIKEKKQNLTEVEVSKYRYELSPEKIVKSCLENNIPSVAYTYNEPIIFFEYLYDTAILARKKGIKNVMVSNGYESKESLEKLKECIDGINVDLKSFNEEFYKKNCQAKLENVLETIKEIYKSKIWLEITTLIIPEHNDSKEELKKIAEFIADIDKNIPWHISAFHPDYKMKDLPRTSHEKLIEAFNIGKKAGLKYIYVGNIIDDERSSTYCPKCNEILIKRAGFSVSIENFKDGECIKCNEKIKGVWK